MKYREILRRKFRELRQLVYVMSRKDIRRLVLAALVGCLAAVSETASIALIPLALREVSRRPIDLQNWLIGGFLIIVTTLLFRVLDIRHRYQTTLDIQINVSERLLRASIIKRVAEGSGLAETRFIAGLTHDIVNLGSVLTYLQNFISQSIFSLIVFACLIYTAGLPSLLISLIALAYYCCITFATAKKVNGLGKTAIEAQQDLLRLLRTKFGLAESLFAYRESEYLTRPYRKATERLFSSQAYANTMISIPKILIDQVVLVIAFLFIIYISRLSLPTEKLGELAALALLYLLSFNKLLPSLQQIYLSMSVIGQNMASANKIVSTLMIYENFSAKRDGIPIDLNSCRQIDIRGLKLPGKMHQVHTETAETPGLSVRLLPGSIHLLQGNSGIGKTTLLKILAGYQSSGGGQILVNGTIVNPHLSEDWAKCVQYVSQSPFMLPGSVEENITLEGLKGSKQSVDLKKLSKILEIVQLAGLDMKTKITDFNEGLSGGQQQRIAIARALFQNPKLLLLDEAFTGIDLATRKQLLHRLAEHLVKHQIFCLAVSHDPLPGIDTQRVLLRRPS